MEPKQDQVPTKEDIETLEEFGKRLVDLVGMMIDGLMSIGFFP